MVTSVSVIAMNGFSLFFGSTKSSASDTKLLDENGSAVDGSMQSKTQEQ